MRHHKSPHKSSRYYVTRTGAASTWKTCTVTDDNNVILLPVINTFYTCQADVYTKMTVGMFMCFTQNEVMCTVGTSSCLSCEDAPRCTSMIWFTYNTSKSGDEQISMKVKEMHNNIYFNIAFSSLVGEQQRYSVVVAY